LQRKQNKDWMYPRNRAERCPSVPIGDFENEIPLSFPREETSLGSGLPSHLPLGDVPCPHGALLTVFSTTQLEHLLKQCVSVPSRFWRYLYKDFDFRSLNGYYRNDKSVGMIDLRDKVMKRQFLFMLVLGFLLSLVSSLYAQFTPEEIAYRPKLEDFLRTAEIISSKDIGEGVTKPCKLDMKSGNEEHSGCWKNPSGMQKGFVEGWQYEIAAYEMDKLLGLNMIPPTVEREFNGKRGSLQFWITSEMSDLERMEQGINIPQDKLESWNKQKYLTRAFDCLIANEDRTQQNIRYKKDWRTILIDHSRSFRSSEKFQKQLVFGKNGVLAQKLFRRLPWVFVENVRALNFDKIKQAVDPCLTDEEIQAVLVRKKLLLDEIEEMIEEKGEANVLY